MPKWHAPIEFLSVSLSADGLFCFTVWPHDADASQYCWASEPASLANRLSHYYSIPHNMNRDIRLTHNAAGSHHDRNHLVPPLRLSRLRLGTHRHLAIARALSLLLPLCLSSSSTHAIIARHGGSSCFDWRDPLFLVGGYLHWRGRARTLLLLCRTYGLRLSL